MPLGCAFVYSRFCVDPVFATNPIASQEIRMHAPKRNTLHGVLATVIALAALNGCGKANDPISAAAQTDKKTGIPAPGIVETKAIAEEGFIYGLPIVMNYAVMYEFSVDKNSGQYKGPFNQIQQRSPRLHLQRHGRRHAEQRHAVFDALVGSARRADGDFGAGGGKGSLLLGAVHRRQYLQLRLHRQPGHRNRAGRLSGGRPRLERRDARGHQEGLPFDDPLRPHHFSHPAVQCRRHAERGARCRPATRRSRFRHS